MDSTRYFVCHGELLQPGAREIADPFSFVQGIAKWRSPRHFVFHLKIYHLTRDRENKVDPAEFLGSLERAGWKCIYLKRENTVQQQLSNLLAEARGSYHKFDDAEESLSIHVNCQSFVDNVKERIRFAEEERACLASLPHIDVIYEEDLLKQERHNETIRKILEYVSLPPVSSSTPHRKVNKHEMNELIENYSEFAECVRANAWEHLL